LSARIMPHSFFFDDALRWFRTDARWRRNHYFLDNPVNLKHIAQFEFTSSPHARKMTNLKFEPVYVELREPPILSYLKSQGVQVVQLAPEKDVDPFEMDCYYEPESVHPVVKSAVVFAPSDDESDIAPIEPSTQLGQVSLRRS
jgi:hypothetical protein